MKHGGHVRNAMLGLVLALSMAVGAVGIPSTTPVDASNDSYCGHGTGHVSLHQWHTNRWRNIWVQSWNGYGKHWHVYVKQYQPSYYPTTPLHYLWFNGGSLEKNC